MAFNGNKLLFNDGYSQKMTLKVRNFIRVKTQLSELFKEIAWHLFVVGLVYIK